VAIRLTREWAAFSELYLLISVFSWTMRYCKLIPVMMLCCGCDGIPRDVSHGLQRITEGELRAGASMNPPWVVVRDGEVLGLEVELIEAWARQHDARVVWQVGAVAELTEALHRRELDVLVAGLDKSTPHAKRLALTQPYLESTNAFGKRHRHVLAVTQGESALLLDLDRYLARQDRGSLLDRVAVMQ
jgi:polar amino acid transport system substrate-binding protein